MTEDMKAMIELVDGEHEEYDQIREIKDEFVENLMVLVEEYLIKKYELECCHDSENMVEDDLKELGCLNERSI